MKKLMISLAMILAAAVSWAEWQEWTPAELVAKSDLIGVGVLGKVSRVETGNLVRCEGVLEFTKVLKGTNAVVVLSWEVAVPPVEDAMDYTSMAGKRAVWFLKSRTNGTFFVVHGDGIQNVSRQKEFETLTQ